MVNIYDFFTNRTIRTMNRVCYIDCDGYNLYLPTHIQDYYGKIGGIYIYHKYNEVILLHNHLIEGNDKTQKIDIEMLNKILSLSEFISKERVEAMIDFKTFDTPFKVYIEKFNNMIKENLKKMIFFENEIYISNTVVFNIKEPSE